LNDLYGLRFRDERRGAMNKKKENITRANFGIWMVGLFGFLHKVTKLYHV
jgi:hypothetical protein